MCKYIKKIFYRHFFQDFSIIWFIGAFKFIIVQKNYKTALKR